MEIYDVVRKLVGPIEPMGDANADETRLKNLNVLIDLTDRLIVDIRNVSRYKYSYEASVKELGKTSEKFIDSLKD